MKRMGFKGSTLYITGYHYYSNLLTLAHIEGNQLFRFDYQLNDQQKSKLSLDEKFNVDLFNENADYVIMFVDMNRFSFPEDTQGKVDEVIYNVNEFKKILSDKSGFIELSGELKEKVRANYNKLIEDTDFFINNYDFPDRENLKLVMEDTKKCFVQSNFIGLAGYSNALKDERNARCTLAYRSIHSNICCPELVLGLGLAIIMNKA